MRILIVTQYIHPEPFKSTELASELVKRGHHVDVLTGIPNYPEGRYYKGYGIFSRRRETVNGVRYYRCFQTPRKLLPGFIGQSFNYITFVVSSVAWVFAFFVWKKKYDAVIAYEPSPVTQIIPACILGRIRKVPVYSWIQDIWPDAVISAAGEKGKRLERPLSEITDWVYRHSTSLLITSKGMAGLINRNADYSDKIVYFPQWSDDMAAEDNALAHEITDVRTTAFNIMMAGSINSGIGVPALLALCEEMKDDDVRFIFVGGGSEESAMRKAVRDKGLTNVSFTGRKRPEEMPLYYRQADALLLTLKPTDMPHLDITVPARLQSYLSSGKPVLAMIGSGAREIIEDAGCGYAVAAGDFKALADVIRQKVLTDKEGFGRMGQNGRLWYERWFTREKCIDNLCKILRPV